MAAVYEATHLALNKRVAIKILLPEFRRHPEVAPRFIREGQAAVRVNHPNILDVTDAGTQDGFTFLVMEYLEGSDLAAFFTRELWSPRDIAELPKPLRDLFARWHDVLLLPVEVILDLLLPVVVGVQAAHERGVIHRDLKPQNIFLHCNPVEGIVPKVVDFGISRLLDQESRTQLIMGSLLYMAPEQSYGIQHATSRSDVYALGVILYEGLTGKRPIEHSEHESDLDFLVRLRSAVPTPPRRYRPDLSEGLEQVILQALRHDPVSRYPSAGALGQALLPYAREELRRKLGDLLCAGVVVASPMRQGSPRRRWSVAMGLLAVGLALTAIYNWRLRMIPEGERPSGSAGMPSSSLLVRQPEGTTAGSSKSGPRPSAEAGTRGIEESAVPSPTPPPVGVRRSPQSAASSPRRTNSSGAVHSKVVVPHPLHMEIDADGNPIP